MVNPYAPPKLADTDSRQLNAEPPVASPIFAMAYLLTHSLVGFGFTVTFAIHCYRNTMIKPDEPRVHMMSFMLMFCAVIAAGMTLLPCLIQAAIITLMARSVTRGRCDWLCYFFTINIGVLILFFTCVSVSGHPIPDYVIHFRPTTRVHRPLLAITELPLLASALVGNFCAALSCHWRCNRSIRILPSPNPPHPRSTNPEHDTRVP